MEILVRTAASGEVPAREGVVGLMDEAREQGLLLGVCSAATKSSAICVVQALLGQQRFEVSCDCSVSSRRHCVCCC